MDDIEIVIKISEKEYDAIKENKFGIFGGRIFQAIRDGKPLSEYYPVIHHKKPITKENIDDCIRRSDIGLTDFEIVMCDGNYKQALEMLLTKIEKAPSVIPKSDWIPVTEKLPEKEGTYLTTIDEYIMTSSYFPNCKHGSKWCPDDVIASDNVIAWMPVPEPYKESEEEE